MRPKAAVRQTALQGVSETIDEPDVLAGFEDASISATEAAILSKHHLLDYDEYEQVGVDGL